MQPSIKIRIYKWLDRMLSELVRIVPHPKRAIERGPARVLIIKLSAMGDALCLFPAVRQLAAAFPAAKIDWLTSNRSNPALFDELPFIRTIFVTPPSFARVLAYLAGWLIKARRYDLAIDYDQYYCISELVAGRSAYSAGFKTSLKGTTFSLSIEYEPLLNEKMMFRKLTERVIAVYGASSPEYRAELPELIERFEPGEKLRLLRKQLKEHGKPVIGIYPGSGANAAFRRWDIGNYVSLIEHYKDRFVFVILGGPDEHDLQADLKDIEGVCNLIDTMSLKEVAWLMKYSIDLVVGNDGGAASRRRKPGGCDRGNFRARAIQEMGLLASPFDRRRKGSAMPSVPEELPRDRAVDVLPGHDRMSDRHLDRRRCAGNASDRSSDPRRTVRSCLSACFSFFTVSGGRDAPGHGALPGSPRLHAGDGRTRSSDGARSEWARV